LVAKLRSTTPTSLAAAFPEMRPPAYEDAPGASVKLTEREHNERLAALLERNFRMVWRALRRLGVTPHAVDDAAQDVFIVASRKLEHIGVREERRFLYAVALRVAANARRARAARPETAASEELDRTESSAPSAEALLDRKRARLLLDETLEAMPDDLRTAFVLFELEGCTAPEVADLLGIPVGTAASRLRRARDAFQTRVAELRRRLEEGGTR
jgi:RNA polymerase sigma-70 factor, ECF subfamily